MAKLTISDAARVTRVSRVTLHRYIKAGRLSRSADGTIDTAELLRVGLTLHPDTVQQPVTVQRPATLPVTADTTALERLIDVLHRELEAAREREQAARDREAMLLQMLQQVQQQNQRLLDVGRSAAPAPGERTPRDASPPRGAMRQQILALVRDHPEGLSPAETRRRLGSDKDQGSTMKAMARDGLLRRVTTGCYVLVEARR